MIDREAVTRRIDGCLAANGRFLLMDTFHYATGYLPVEEGSKDRGWGSRVKQPRRKILAIRQTGQRDGGSVANEKRRWREWAKKDFSKGTYFFRSDWCRVYRVVRYGTMSSFFPSLFAASVFVDRNGGRRGLLVTFRLGWRRYETVGEDGKKFLKDSSIDTFHFVRMIR